MSKNAQTPICKSVDQNLEIMIGYVLSNGVKIDSKTIELISWWKNKFCKELKNVEQIQTDEKVEIPDFSSFDKLSDGKKKVPVPASESKSDIELKKLELHELLSRAIEPATPSTLRATIPEGPLGMPETPILRKMLWAGIIAVLFFISALLLEDNLKKYFDDIGKHLIILSGAILGSIFYNLSQIHKYLVDRTFDPKYNSVYVTRFIIGIISGFILGFSASEGLLGDPSSLGNGTVESVNVTYGLFAIIGGFASDAVHIILERLAQSATMIFQGSPKEEKDRINELAREKKEMELEKSSINHVGNLREIEVLLAQADGDAGKISSRISELIKENEKRIK